MAAVVVKKEEKVRNVLSNMKDISSVDEFKMLFKDMYPKEWANICRVYQAEKAKDTKNKGTPMPHPETYLRNMYNVGVKKYRQESDVK